MGEEVPGERVPEGRESPRGTCVRGCWFRVASEGWRGFSSFIRSAALVGAVCDAAPVLRGA